MIRLLIWLLALAPVVAGGLWLAEHPARLSVFMLGWQIESPLWLWVALWLAAAVLLMGLAMGLRALTTLPAQLSARRKLSHYEQALDGVASAMAALTLADHSRAQKQIEAAARHIGATHPAVLLLSTQLAHAQGKPQLIHSQLEAMLTSGSTRAVGLRGLIEEQMSARDVASALHYATMAHEERPTDRWITLVMLDLLSRSRRWQEAHTMLSSARRHRALSREEVIRYRAMLTLAELNAQEAPVAEAQKVLKQAIRHSPDFYPAAVELIRLAAACQDVATVAAQLKRIWRHHPHLPSGLLLINAWKDTSPRAQRKQIEGIIRTHPDCVESPLLMARWYMAQQAWDEARQQLRNALIFRESAAIYEAYAEIERGQQADEAKAAEWLRRARLCAPDAAWVCGACGHNSDAWQLHCPSCQHFDSVSWQQPDAAGATVLPPANANSAA